MKWLTLMALLAMLAWSLLASAQDATGTPERSVAAETMATVRTSVSAAPLDALDAMDKALLRQLILERQADIERELAVLDQERRSPYREHAVPNREPPRSLAPVVEVHTKADAPKVSRDAPLIHVLALAGTILLTCAAFLAFVIRPPVGGAANAVIVVMTLAVVVVGLVAGVSGDKFAALPAVAMGIVTRLLGRPKTPPATPGPAA